MRTPKIPLTSAVAVVKLAAMQSNTPVEQVSKAPDFSPSCKQEVQTYLVETGLWCSAYTQDLREILRTDPTRRFGGAAAAGMIASAVCGIVYGSLLVAARRLRRELFRNLRPIRVGRRRHLQREQS
jgi:hypothetical protein